MKAQAAEGEQQSSLHHLWGRQESEVRGWDQGQRWSLGVSGLEEETHTVSSVE